MRERHRYLVALVVAGDVALEVNGLRRALSSHDVERIAPHITIVPPTNVGAENIDDVATTLHRIASSTPPIAVTLGPPTTFPDRDDIVFLGVHGDLSALRTLHEKLNVGVFAPPSSREPRSFVPHVTLAGKFRGDRAWSACTALLGYAMPYTFTSVVLLEQDTAQQAHPWAVVAEFDFDGDVVVGRGGRELAFSMSRDLDPSAQRFLEDEWAKYAIATYGPPAPVQDNFALVVRNADEIVGLGTGSITGETWWLDRLIVKDGRRGEGIGGQLLRQLETNCRDRSGARIRLVTNAEGSARKLYESNGYPIMVELPNWRAGRRFVMMERLLAS